MTTKLDVTGLQPDTACSIGYFFNDLAGRLNLVTPAKNQVAETLKQFRGNYQHNLMDENLCRFNAKVPIHAQWDDRVALNNWYPGERLGDPRYTETSVDLLAARAHRAFIKYMPVHFRERNHLFQHFPNGSCSTFSASTYAASAAPTRQ